MEQVSHGRRPRYVTNDQPELTQSLQVLSWSLSEVAWSTSLVCCLQYNDYSLTHQSPNILVLIAYQHTCLASPMTNQCLHSNHIHGLNWSLARDSLLYYSCTSSDNLHSQVQICEHQFCRTSSNRRRAPMFNLSRCNEHKTLCSSVPRSPISFQPFIS